MVQFRKRKSDGQSFPIGTTKKIRASNPSNDVGGLRLGKGTKIPDMSEEEERQNRIKSLRGTRKFLTDENQIKYDELFEKKPIEELSIPELIDLWLLTGEWERDDNKILQDIEQRQKTSGISSNDELLRDSIIQNRIDEETELKPMGTFEDAFKKAFEEGKSRK